MEFLFLNIHLCESGIFQFEMWIVLKIDLGYECQNEF